MIYHLIINQARDSAQLVHHALDLRHVFRLITNQTFSTTGKSSFDFKYYSYDHKKKLYK